jgi:hypothetical protein
MAEPHYGHVTMELLISSLAQTGPLAKRFASASLCK